MAGLIRSTTVSKTPTGKYFVSVLCETGVAIPEKQNFSPEKVNGIDVGLSRFAVTSDGKIIENPKFLKQSLDRLKVLQRRLSRKKKGSSNRKKAQHKVAVAHEKIANQRKDFIHKISAQLVRNHDAIVMKDDAKRQKVSENLRKGLTEGFVQEVTQLHKDQKLPEEEGNDIVEDVVQTNPPEEVEVEADVDNVIPEAQPEEVEVKPEEVVPSEEPEITEGFDEIEEETTQPEELNKDSDENDIDPNSILKG